MTAPLDRARQLIELATNDSANANEARNAAMRAVKLIKQHGLLAGQHRPDFARMSIEEILEQGRRYNEWAGPTPSYQPHPHERDVGAEERARQSWEEAKARKAARGEIDPDFANSTTLPKRTKKARAA